MLPLAKVCYIGRKLICYVCLFSNDSYIGRRLFRAVKIESFDAVGGCVYFGPMVVPARIIIISVLLAIICLVRKGSQVLQVAVYVVVVIDPEVCVWNRCKANIGQFFFIEDALLVDGGGGYLESDDPEDSHEDHGG